MTNCVSIYFKYHIVRVLLVCVSFPASLPSHLRQSRRNALSQSQTPSGGLRLQNSKDPTLNTVSARKRRAVFNRFAHSAGPYCWMLHCASWLFVFAVVYVVLLACSCACFFSLRVLFIPFFCLSFCLCVCVFVCSGWLFDVSVIASLLLLQCFCVLICLLFVLYF